MAAFKLCTVPATGSLSGTGGYESLTVVRQELGLVAGLALIAVIGARLIGSDTDWIAGAIAVYSAWRVANFWRLLYWLSQ